MPVNKYIETSGKSAASLSTIVYFPIQ
jgi:hypothetical protein